MRNYCLLNTENGLKNGYKKYLIQNKLYKILFMLYKYFIILIVL